MEGHCEGLCFKFHTLCAHDLGGSVVSQEILSTSLLGSHFMGSESPLVRQPSASHETALDAAEASREVLSLGVS